MDTEMSTNIDDLNNMQELSMNIETELDNGEADNTNAGNSVSLENLKKIQLQQLEQLKELKEIQQIKNNDDSLKNEINKNKVNENRKQLFKNCMNVIKEPLMILFLYIIISYPRSQNFIGRFVPYFTNDTLTFLNILVQSLIIFLILIIYKSVLLMYK